MSIFIQRVERRNDLKKRRQYQCSFVHFVFLASAVFYLLARSLQDLFYLSLSHLPHAHSHSTSLPLLFNLFFFSLLISPFLSHTRTLSPSVSRLTQLMQNVPTQSDECVCVYVFPVILFKSILTIAFCSTLSSFFFHHSSSKFARFLFFLFKSLHVLTHSLTLVNRFGSGGTGGRTGWLCEEGKGGDVRWQWSKGEGEKTGYIRGICTAHEDML